MSDPKVYMVTVVVNGAEIKATKIEQNGKTLMPEEDDENRVEYQYENKDDFQITEEMEQQLKDNNRVISSNLQEKTNVSPNILKNETTDFTINERQLNNNGVTTARPKGFTMPTARKSTPTTFQGQLNSTARLSEPRFKTKKIIPSNDIPFKGGKSRRSVTRKNKKKTKTMRRKRRNL